jgi:hypothetical protein
MVIGEVYSSFGVYFRGFSSSDSEPTIFGLFDNVNIPIVMTAVADGESKSPKSFSSSGWIPGRCIKDPTRNTHIELARTLLRSLPQLNRAVDLIRTYGRGIDVIRELAHDATDYIDRFARTKAILTYASNKEMII